MGILKDFIIICILSFSLYVLYLTKNQEIALLSIIVITLVYFVKHIKKGQYFKNKAEREIVRQKEYFIETLIHDLKIPTLAQLRGLELIQNETVGTINSDQKELISQITDSCKYILDMISMVLKTYKYENGQKTCQFEMFNITELLIECFAELSNIAKEKNINLIYECKNEDSILEGDKIDLKTVIVNLLSNAIIYANHNEKIVVKIEVTSNFLKFLISSYGITLSQRECEGMFNNIIDNTPKYTTIGNGIGLYLCKKIIECHNGQIFASSNGMNQNNFIFILPRVQKKHNFELCVDGNECLTFVKKK